MLVQCLANIVNGMPASKQCWVSPTFYFVYREYEENLVEAEEDEINLYLSIKTVDLI